MSQRPSTFGGEWHRPDHTGRAHTTREAQDRASYDNAPATSGCGGAALLLLTSFLAMLIAVLTGVTS